MKACKFCGIKNKSIGIHQKFCKLNPDRSKNIQNSTHIGKCLNEEDEKIRREKISKTMKKNPLAGGLREGSGRGLKTWYESPIAGRVYLRSSYELAYVKYLDANQIKWKQNIKSFEYVFNEKKRRYFPDFYLIDEGCFVEIKGFKTKQDEAKWSYFPYKLQILYGKDIKQMEVQSDGCRRNRL